jgi:hypothetical protein
MKLAAKIGIGTKTEGSRDGASPGQPMGTNVYPSNSSSMVCISLRAWRLPARAAQLMPALSRPIASSLRP